MYAPHVRTGFAIIGPYGNVWHPSVFDTPAEAESYLDQFWKGNYDRTKWKIAPATATVAVETITEVRQIEASPLPSLK